MYKRPLYLETECIYFPHLLLFLFLPFGMFWDQPTTPYWYIYILKKTAIYITYHTNSSSPKSSLSSQNATSLWPRVLMWHVGVSIVSFSAIVFFFFRSWSANGRVSTNTYTFLHMRRFLGGGGGGGLLRFRPPFAPLFVVRVVFSPHYNEALLERKGSAFPLPTPFFFTNDLATLFRTIITVCVECY